MAWCELAGKMGYDKRSAETAKNARVREGSRTLRVYQCEHGDHWHLTKVKDWSRYE